MRNQKTHKIFYLFFTFFFVFLLFPNISKAAGLTPPIDDGSANGPDVLPPLPTTQAAGANYTGGPNYNNTAGGGSFTMSAQAQAQADANESFNAGNNNSNGSSQSGGTNPATEVNLAALQQQSQSLQNNQTLQQTSSEQEEIAAENEMAAAAAGNGAGSGTNGGASGSGGSGGSSSSGNSSTSGGSGGSSNTSSSNTTVDSAKNVCSRGSCTYQMLAPIPGFLGNSSGKYVITQDSKSLCALLNQWFRIGIALAGMLAVVMIVLGGFQYATTDSLFDKSDGKGKIQNALWGLGLALTTWLVLSTVNPELTKCELKATATQLTAVPVATGSGNIITATNGVLGTSGGSSSGETITTAPDGGIVVSTTGVRLDSDGRVAPSYSDPTRQSETSYKPGGKSMDATTEAYVVAPMDSSGKSTVPMGTTALIQNETTGKQVWAVVGDAGSQANGWGEMSVYAAVQIGAADGKSDSAANHKIKITYYPNK